MRYRFISGIDHYIVTAAFTAQLQCEIFIVGYIVENVVIYIFGKETAAYTLYCSTCKTLGTKFRPILRFKVIIIQLKAVESISLYGEILHKVAVGHLGGTTIFCRMNTAGKKACTDTYRTAVIGVYTGPAAPVACKACSKTTVIDRPQGIAAFYRRSILCIGNDLTGFRRIRCHCDVASIVAIANDTAGIIDTDDTGNKSGIAICLHCTVATKVGQLCCGNGCGIGAEFYGTGVCSGNPSDGSTPGTNFNLVMTIGNRSAVVNRNDAYTAEGKIDILPGKGQVFNCSAVLIYKAFGVGFTTEHTGSHVIIVVMTKIYILDRVTVTVKGAGKGFVIPHGRPDKITEVDILGHLSIGGRVLGYAFQRTVHKTGEPGKLSAAGDQIGAFLILARLRGHRRPAEVILFRSCGTDQHPFGYRNRLYRSGIFHGKLAVVFLGPEIEEIVILTIGYRVTAIGGVIDRNTLRRTGDGHLRLPVDGLTVGRVGADYRCYNGRGRNGIDRAEIHTIFVSNGLYRIGERNRFRIFFTIANAGNGPIGGIENRCPFGSRGHGNGNFITEAAAA